MPQATNDKPIHQRLHPEWVEHHRQWTWLYDSWEGGERYRTAVYGHGPHGVPLHNLVRHKREYPDPTEADFASAATPDLVGADPSRRAWDDDFQFRRARTPAPSIVEHAVEAHLSKIYAREITRQGPPDLTAWWADVDGRGSSIDDWMEDVIAPLMLVLGQLDVLFDRPPAPEGVEIRTRADQKRHGLDAVIASYILPQNMRWWRLDRRGNYLECVVAEYDENGEPTYRHWTEAESRLYDQHGKPLGEPIPHPYGRPPIVRLFHRRNPRFGNVGRSRYQSLAEIQREFYNRDSELILSDSIQAHPLIEGPEDYLSGDSSISIGPGWVLPKVKHEKGTTVTYEGWGVLEFPKGGAESIRQNKADLMDRADRDAMLTKPAGARGSDGRTVAQSGLSKRLDAAQGNDYLAKLAARLQAAETTMARLALQVLADGAESREAEAVAVVYPKGFDLFASDELAAAISELQAVVAASGAIPITEVECVRRLVRQLLPGLADERYAEIDAEIQGAILGRAEKRDQWAEGESNPFGDPTNQPERDDRAEPDDGGGGARQPEEPD